MEALVESGAIEMAVGLGWGYLIFGGIMAIGVFAFMGIVAYKIFKSHDRMGRRF